MRFSVEKDSADHLVLDQIERPTNYRAWDVPGPGFFENFSSITPESIRGERRRFKAHKPLLLAMIGNMKQELTFHMPGSVQRSSNFETVTPGVLRVRFNGERLVNALEEMVCDDKVAQTLSATPPQQHESAAIRIFNEKV